MSLDPRIAEFVQLKADLDAKIDRVREAVAELESQRFMARSDHVSVVVDGQAALKALHITDGALAKPHPEQLGAEITATVARARALASEEHRKRFHELLPGLFPGDEDV